MSDLVLYAIPAFVVLLIVEAVWAARQRDGRITGYEKVDTAASLTMGLGNVAISAVTKLGALALFTWLYQYRLIDWSGVPVVLAWVTLFFAEDLCYYWFHRLHHTVRFLWAAHVNHHSSQRYNLATALRQSWTTPFTAPWFWAPLALAGFSPWMIMTAQAWSLIYQYWIHTEAIGKLGVLEEVFNTPSHHRVHHGTNLEYLDKNHGGVLILWDRLFGSFAREQAPVRYGISHNLTSHHPFTIAFHEWAAIGRDLRRATNWRQRLGAVFAAPGWSADGTSLTARQLQAQARAATSTSHRA